MDTHAHLTTSTILSHCATNYYGYNTFSYKSFQVMSNIKKMLKGVKLPMAFNKFSTICCITPKHAFNNKVILHPPPLVTISISTKNINVIQLQLSFSIWSKFNLHQLNTADGSLQKMNTPENIWCAGLCIDHIFTSAKIESYWNWNCFGE